MKGVLIAVLMVWGLFSCNKKDSFSFLYTDNQQNKGNTIATGIAFINLIPQEGKLYFIDYDNQQSLSALAYKERTMFGAMGTTSAYRAFYPGIRTFLVYHSLYPDKKFVQSFSTYSQKTYSIFATQKADSIVLYKVEDTIPATDDPKAMIRFINFSQSLNEAHFVVGQNDIRNKKELNATILKNKPSKYLFLEPASYNVMANEYLQKTLYARAGNSYTICLIGKKDEEKTAYPLELMIFNTK